MHEEALTEESAKLFPKFSRFEDFYLVGGTALSIQIGHRISVDFDFFSKKALAAGLLSKVKRVFDDSSISVTYQSPEQLNVLSDGVKITFLYYNYPIVDPFVEYGSVKLASIREIAAMKAFAIGKRLSYKDYIDWYFLLKEKYVTLAEVIKHAEEKFGNDFNDRLFLGQLVSFEDIPTQKIDFLRDPLERNTAEAYLIEAVRAFSL